MLGLYWGPLILGNYHFWVYRVYGVDRVHRVYRVHRVQGLRFKGLVLGVAGVDQQIVEIFEAWGLWDIISAGLGLLHDC